MTIIRQADIVEDMPEIMAGAKDFISRMDYRDFLPETDAELEAALAVLLTVPGVEATVAEENGRIVGGIGMSHLPCIWNPKVIPGEEQFWWTAPDASPTVALRILRTAMARAREYEASFVIFKALTSSPPGVGRVYRALGLRPIETTWMGRL